MGKIDTKAKSIRDFINERVETYPRRLKDFKGKREVFLERELESIESHLNENDTYIEQRMLDFALWISHNQREYDLCVSANDLLDEFLKSES